ncbi:MAG TPA: tripartite tricarboxylate transporter substrate binding protein [Casimicrobiaceae bacterium]|nr:tripartite tricarboxylate transporter substrate binding protein [Casimicrobiaceae bacterium]
MKTIAAIVLLWACIMPVHAQPYPNKPIRLIVPYPAGGGTDIAARWIAQKLSEALNQSVVIDNRPGANGNIGTDMIAKAPADGYTIGMATPGPVTVGRSLYAKLPYDPEKDFTPIILANDSPIVLVVNPRVAAKSMQELVALAKAQPGKLTAALVSTGSVPHLLTEMMKGAAGVDIFDVPYKGGSPAATDVMGGQVDMLFSVLPLVLPFIQSGKLRAIAVASEQRSALIPDVPTMREAGYPPVVGSAWNGIVGPAGVPPDVVARLNGEIARVLEAPETRQHFAATGMEPGRGSPQRFAEFLHAETEKWAAVIKAANIQAE